MIVKQLYCIVISFIWFDSW